MNIIILSCPALIKQRLPNLLQQLLPSFSCGNVESLNIITGSDDYLLDNHIFQYDPSLWTKHISSAWPAYFRNIVDRYAQKNSFKNHLDALKSLPVLMPTEETFFPTRELTNIELSIARRHFIAWRQAASNKGMTLILEDDALPDNSLGLLDLYSFLESYDFNDTFIDLADTYIPGLNLSDKPAVDFKSLHFYQRTLALTRTLMSYAISPTIAELIIAESTKYSLPVDMHVQMVLLTNKVRGLALTSNVFTHASKYGAYTSSTGDF